MKELVHLNVRHRRDVFVLRFEGCVSLLVGQALCRKRVLEMVLSYLCSKVEFQAIVENNFRKK